MNNNLDFSFKIHTIPPTSTSKLRAFVSLEIAGICRINSIRIIDGAKGLFVGMPRRKDNGGRFHSIVFLTDKDLREKIECEILEEYERLIAEEQQ